jgi:DNA modification methylase
VAPESVQTCVTSPPYFGLRDYGYDGQLGLEATPDDYVTALVETFREVRRVLADDGTLWLNLGDSYSTVPSGNHSAQRDRPQVGWEPSCEHEDGSGTCTVLDPFAGSGTTGVVALRHGRSFIGCELNAEYIELARRRIIDDAPLFNSCAEAS